MADTTPDTLGEVPPTPTSRTSGASRDLSPAFSSHVSFPDPVVEPLPEGRLFAAAEVSEIVADRLARARRSISEGFEAQLASARAELEAARFEVLRFRVAADHGISSEEAAVLLTGTDEAQLVAQAVRLQGLGVRRA